MVKGLTTYKSVNGFTDEQLDLMRAFLQGAVYCWCKNRKDEWFAARDLLGGDNYYWQGIPLIQLYDYYLNGDEDNHDYAVEEAGKACRSSSEGSADQRQANLRNRGRLYSQI